MSCLETARLVQRCSRDSNRATVRWGAPTPAANNSNAAEAIIVVVPRIERRCRVCRWNCGSVWLFGHESRVLPWRWFSPVREQPVEEPVPVGRVADAVAGTAIDCEGHVATHLSCRTSTIACSPSSGTTLSLSPRNAQMGRFLSLSACSTLPPPHKGTIAANRSGS